MTKEYDENYLLALVDLATCEAFYTVVRGRKSLARIMENLSTKKYYVSGVQMLQKVKDEDELLKELIEDSKDTGMEFGIEG